MEREGGREGYDETDLFQHVNVLQNTFQGHSQKSWGFETGVV